MSTDDLGQLLINELLPNEKGLGKTSAEILRTLEERYGTPQSADEGEEKKLSFELEELTLIVLVSKLSGYITGGETTQKQMAPCVPVRINPGFVGSGRGTATLPIFMVPALQAGIAIAFGQAVIDAITKLNAHKARICGAAPCVPGCTCTQNYSFTPPIVTPTTNYFLGFIPVSITVNVSFPYTGGYMCQ